MPGDPGRVTAPQSSLRASPRGQAYPAGPIRPAGHRSPALAGRGPRRHQCSIGAAL